MPYGQTRTTPRQQQAAHTGLHVHSELGNAGAQIVQDYAEKRRQQLEKAKHIREERERLRKDAVQQEEPAPPRVTPQQQQAPLHHGQPSPGLQYGYNVRADAVPQADIAPPQRVGSWTQQHQKQPPQQYASHQSSYPPVETSEPPPRRVGSGATLVPVAQGDGGGAVVVSERDLRAAVSVGIITLDQSRKLWEVLLQTSRPATPSNSAAVHVPDDSGTPVINGGRVPASRVSAPVRRSAEAPPSDAMQIDDTPIERKSSNRVQPRRPVPSTGTTAVSAPSSGRPDWNFDEAPVGGGGDGCFGEPPPVRGAQPRAGGEKRPRAERTPQKPMREQQPKARRPEWSMDEAPVGGGGFGEPPPIQQRAGSGRMGGAAPRAEPPSMPSHQRGNVGHMPQMGQQMGHMGAPPMEEQPGEDMVAGGGMTAQELEMEAMQAASEPQGECPECGRTFRVSVLARHSKICGKKSNRKVFNVAKQRADALPTEYQRGAIKVAKEVQKESEMRIKAEDQGRPPPQKQAGGASKWKAQSEQFQAAMRAARTATQVEQGQLPASALAALPTPVDDRTPCPHCGRKFAKDVADRHIPKCKTILNKPKTLVPRRR
eukprot:Hpha_TRINITY_DN13645_c0_g1::TRINITY_DN13645_c0_g1_i2::g.122444::m.122444